MAEKENELHTTPKATLREIFEKTKPNVIALENVRKGDEDWDGYCGRVVEKSYQKLKCLSCGDCWTADARTFRHKGETVCPACGAAAQVLNIRKMKSSREVHENFVVITAENPQSVWVECLRMNYRIPLSSAAEETEIGYNTEPKALYHLTPGKSEKWRTSYSYMFGLWDYAPIKRLSGYSFLTSMFGGEEGAILYGEKALSGTFLQYARPGEITAHTNSAYWYTSYLIDFARYPVWAELIDKLRGTKYAMELPKPRGVKYRTAKTVAELFPKLDKERLRILLRLIAREKGADVGELYSAAQKKPPELMRRVERTGQRFLPMLEACEESGQKPEKIARYLTVQNATAALYRDYLSECKKLEYDLTDKRVLFPKSLTEKHAETSELIRYRATPESVEKSRKRAEKLKKAGTEYRHGKLMIRVPGDCTEIIKEGAELGHCVGNYAEKHADGKTTILFVRKRNDPETPYFTLEIDLKSGSVKQCYGRKNLVSYHQNMAVGQLLEHYKRHLDYLSKKKGRKTV